MPEPKVLLRRVPMGAGLWVLLIVELLIGIGVGAGAVFLIIAGQSQAMMVIAVIFLIFAGWMALTFVYALARVIKSKNAGPYCLLYHEESEEYELFPIFRPSFRVKKDDFITVQRNFFTDFLVIAAFYQNGRLKKVRLGWSLDVPNALPAIAKIREGKKEEGE